MLPLIAVKSGFSSIPADAWMWGAALLLVAAAVGFASGYCYARMSVKWAFNRAQKHISKLFAVVMESLENAQQACALLEKFPNLKLTSGERKTLDVKQSRLLETVNTIVEKCTPQPEKNTKTGKPADRPEPEQFMERWTRTPQEAATEVPDRSAFDANLTTLLEMGTAAEFESGLLLVKVDKFDQLNSRFGPQVAKQLLKKMAGLLCRTLRDQDALCQYSPDTFGILIPDVDDETGPSLALAIRNTVRSYHFRLDASGPEYVVTASFGYTRCQQNDNFDLVLNRAGNGLAKSQRRGRNQLHVHDGSDLSYCSVN